jgi:hypothetical protein
VKEKEECSTESNLGFFERLSKNISCPLGTAAARSKHRIKIQTIFFFHISYTKKLRFESNLSL